MLTAFCVERRYHGYPHHRLLAFAPHATPEIRHSHGIVVDAEHSSAAGPCNLTNTAQNRLECNQSLLRQLLNLAKLLQLSVQFQASLFRIFVQQ
jgi:hypothetical protein